MHLDSLFRLTVEQKKALTRLRIKTVEDLLYYFPSRYGAQADIKKIGTLQKGDHATVFGKIVSAKTSKAFRKKIPIGEMVIEDESGKIKAVWYSQAYMAKAAPVGSLVRLNGKVTERKGVLYLANPAFGDIKKVPVQSENSLFGNGDDSLFPVYSETKGLSTRWFQYHIETLLSKKEILETLTDPIPQAILKKYSLPTLKTALRWIHAPQKHGDAQAARKRFAFEEIFFIQLKRLKLRESYKKNPSFIVDSGEKHIEEFTSRFSFPLTKAQKRATEDILKDFRSGHPMTRLLEGDVGSGKTAVAASIAYAIIHARADDKLPLQVAYMAPTEILAEQHFGSFIELFRHLPVEIGLITGSGCKKFPSKVNPEGWTTISRSQMLKWVKEGKVSIVIGTHALIEKSVVFKHLGLGIIDEQHRFGTIQRSKLVRKEKRVPHLLSMTATPIPRTLALTIYGDLDISLLDELPAGRKQVETQVVPNRKRDDVYAHMRQEIAKGRQAYVICPRIDEPDPDKALALNTKSVKEEAKRLQEKVFPELSIGILHGKMKPKEKEEVMDDFAKGRIHILVATSVVEVGVNVPNATVIVIEGAERFGLSQLHQLRGRVQRSTHTPYCFLFSGTSTEKTNDRLKAIVTAKNGFELSELDLELRGPGELSGNKQWGISDLGMEAIKNLKMVEAARKEAQELISKDPELKTFLFLSEDDTPHHLE